MVVSPPRSFMAATFMPIDESPGELVKIGTPHLAAVATQERCGRGAFARMRWPR